MSALKKLAGQTVVYGVSNVVGRLLNYLLVPLYTYTFLPQEYGIVTEFYAYVVVLQIILTYGMETGLFRFSKSANFSADVVFATVLKSVLSTSIFFLVTVLFFSDKISLFLGYSNHTDFVIIFAFILVFDAISAIFFAKLRILNKALKFAFFKIANIMINIFFNIFFIVLCPYLYSKGYNFVLNFYSPDFGVGYIFVSNLIASSVVLILFFPYFKYLKVALDKKLLKKILAYSLPLLLTGLTGAINEVADKVLIKYWTIVPSNVVNSGEYVLRQLGIYGANAKLSLLMMLFVQAFRYAAEPFFFSYTNDNSRRLQVFANVMKYYVIFAFLMFLLVLLNIDIIKIIISKQYYEGLNVVFPLFISRFLVGVFFILSFWYKLNDVNQKAILIFATGSAIIIILDYFFIPIWGYQGAAWTNLIANFVMVIFSYIWSRKYFRTPYDLKRIFNYAFLALFIYFVSLKIQMSNTILTLLFKNILIILYFIIVIKLEKIKISDLKKIIHTKNGSKNNKQIN